MKVLGAVLVVFLLTASLTPSAAQEQRLVLDEDVWVTFYDLPSRRFRNIRDAYLRRDFASVSRDINVASSYLAVETERARPELQGALGEVTRRLQEIGDGLPDSFVSIEQLDNVFGRAHWLLSQHFFVLSMQSRDAAEHRTAGLYLAATAHHMERSVLWSEARINRDILRSLEGIREMAGRLQESRRPERVYRDEPLRLAARTLRSIGNHLDRRLRIEPVMPK